MGGLCAARSSSRVETVCLLSIDAPGLIPASVVAGTAFAGLQAHNNAVTRLT